MSKQCEVDSQPKQAGCPMKHESANSGITSDAQLARSHRESAPSPGPNLSSTPEIEVSSCHFCGSFEKLFVSMGLPLAKRCEPEVMDDLFEEQSLKQCMNRQIKTNETARRYEGGQWKAYLLWDARNIAERGQSNGNVRPPKSARSVVRKLNMTISPFLPALSALIPSGARQSAILMIARHISSSAMWRVLNRRRGSYPLVRSTRIFLAHFCHSQPANMSDAMVRNDALLLKRTCWGHT